jgi:uncharacterized iron-regulated membrane protein
MAPRTLRAWAWIHKWTSLVCTLFMLVLCVTGLPLIFYDEIDHLAGGAVTTPRLPEGTPRAPLDAVVRAAQAQHPGKLPLYVFADEHDPDLWLVKLDDRVDSDETRAVFAAVDARTAQVLGTPVFNEGLMHVFYRLHVDGFAGQAGRLTLGAMGLLLVLSIVSGVVLYAPFMRRLDFGTVRHARSPQLRWLDLHNLLGIVTLAWALVVGATGIINTWADLILKDWQAGQLAALRGLPDAATAAATSPPVDGAMQHAVDVALAARPGRKIHLLAFPGTLLATPAHFAVQLVGSSPLTARLQEPVLVEARSGRLTTAAPRPWTVTALQLSQPLHFGDYGALPLKFLWALLDVITIVVLWSGLVLWWRKRRRPRPAARMAVA